MRIFGIILIVAIIIAYFITTALLKDTKKYGDEDDDGFYKNLRLIVCGVLGGLLSMVVVFASISLIDSTEVGVVRSFGRIDREIGEGLNIKNPVSETVDKYDLRVHIKSVEFESYTKDAQPVIVTAEYVCSIDLSQVFLEDVEQKEGIE